ncbi:hypothetical protein BH18CHL2_BH18CHL2_03700 [soil metagenome]
MAKILVSIDDKLLKRIDRAARRLRLTRSTYLARLAARDLGGERGAGADPQARGALNELDRLFAENATTGDVTEVIRSMRDARQAETP